MTEQLDLVLESAVAPRSECLSRLKLYLEIAFPKMFLKCFALICNKESE